MRLRRKRLAAVLRPDEHAITMPAFPTLGVGDFAEPAAAAGHDATSRLAALPRTLLGPLSEPSRRQRRDAVGQRARRAHHAASALPRAHSQHTPAARLQGGGYLPTSPHISSYLPISPHISPYLPISPHISKAAERDAAAPLLRAEQTACLTLSHRSPTRTGPCTLNAVPAPVVQTWSREG